ncbi:MAG TPA: class I SAM-dependent methyltransferase [Thermoanaerobaculia bacterium]|nr:class I SAM-dependent methyltransferase [Thermoanaerobaculia bacterium]
MPACLICQTAIEPFIDFGKMPIANGFLTPDQFPDEYFFNLRVAHCPKCSMVQLTELVEERRMFHENYAFFSSTSAWMQRHFAGFASFVLDRYVTNEDPFVVEIGSNDGIMLRHFAERGIRHLGIEPSANVAAVARERGVNTIGEFFGEELARRIVAEHGQADAFLGANVMCHIPYMHSVVEGIRLLLKPTGVLIFEDPFLGDIVEKTSYDQIYDEHAFYFSVGSLRNLFAMHGMEIIEALPQAVHGGSMRYVVAHQGAFPVGESVRSVEALEARLGLSTPECYERLRANIEASRDALRKLLQAKRDAGQRVVGYAATSKSTTVTNYCGITPDLVEFISDTTPIKQGKFSPGVHIPVRPHDEFARSYPDYALLFGWNHRDEIVAKESAFRDAGGKWIVYVPRVEVVE